MTMWKAANTAMLTKTQIQELKPKIKEALQNIYSSMNIADIDIDSDEDYDGDPILRLHIHYSGKIPDTGGIRAKALDTIRDILEKEKDSSFPVMTFIMEGHKRSGGRAS